MPTTNLPGPPGQAGTDLSVSRPSADRFCETKALGVKAANVACLIRRGQPDGLVDPIQVLNGFYDRIEQMPIADFQTSAR